MPRAIRRYVSTKYGFMVLFDGEEFRFSPDARPTGTAEDQWESAYDGEMLENMFDEYQRIKARAH